MYSTIPCLPEEPKDDSGLGDLKCSISTWRRPRTTPRPIGTGPTESPEPKIWKPFNNKLTKSHFVKNQTILQIVFLKWLMLHYITGPKIRCSCIHCAQ